MYSKERLVEFFIYYVLPVGFLLVLLLAFVLVAYITEVRSCVSC